MIQCWGLKPRGKGIMEADLKQHLPPGKRYRVIYADPPWLYDNPTPGREIPYDQMTLEELMAMDIPADDDAVLYLWAVVPLLPEALKVMEAWGFTYKSNAVWDKDMAGCGFWWRVQHEHLLVGVRGGVKPPIPRRRRSSVFRSRRSRIHSEKPKGVRDYLTAAWPNCSRLELFCREAAPGWDVFGNQVTEAPATLFDPVELVFQDEIPEAG